MIVAVALLLGTPFFIVFGALSDRIGRKKIMMAGCLLGALTYLPIYHADAAVHAGRRQLQPVVLIALRLRPGAST